MRADIRFLEATLDEASDLVDSSENADKVRKVSKLIDDHICSKMTKEELCQKLRLILN